MAARRFVPKHNCLVNLNPMQPETEYYHPVFDFLRNSRVNHVLTQSPVLYLTYIEQFWSSAAYVSNANPPVIRARVANVDIEFSAEFLCIALHLGSPQQESGPTTFPRELRSGAFRRMGYVGDIAKNTYFKSDLYGRWRYLAHVLMVSLSNKKSGWDTLNVETQSHIIALTYNKPYSFSQFFFNEMRDQIGGAYRERFLLYPRFVMMIINFLIPNLQPVGHTVEVAGLDKRVYKDFTSFRANKPAERRAQEVPLFGALVNPAYQAPPEDGWEDVAPGQQPVVASNEEVAQVQQEHQAPVQVEQPPPKADVVNDMLDQLQNPQDGEAPVHPEIAEELIQGILQPAVEDVLVQVENYVINQGDIVMADAEGSKEPGEAVDACKSVDLGLDGDDSDDISESDNDSDDDDSGKDYQMVRVGSREIAVPRQKPQLEYVSRRKRSLYVPDKEDETSLVHRKLKIRRKADDAGTSSSLAQAATIVTETAAATTVTTPTVPISEPIIAPEVHTTTTSVPVLSPSVTTVIIPEPTQPSSSLFKLLDLEGKYMVLEAQVRMLSAQLEAQLAEHKRQMDAMAQQVNALNKKLESERVSHNEHIDMMIDKIEHTLQLVAASNIQYDNLEHDVLHNRKLIVNQKNALTLFVNFLDFLKETPLLK